MDTDPASKSKLDRASESSRKQRDGTEFHGGYGKKTGESELRFVEGRLPENGDGLASDAAPTRQLEICLQNLETELERHGTALNDVFKVTMYLTEMDAYEQMNSKYEQHFDRPYPTRTTVGVCELLGGAAVTVNAVVAIEWT